MPSPVERLEERKQLGECRVCAWLSTLNPTERKGWADAISNPRYGAGIVSEEIRVDQKAAGYSGMEIGGSSVDTHRRKGHR